MRHTEEAMQKGMELFKEGFINALDENNINASGRTKSETEVRLISTPTLVSGSVLTVDYWRYPNFGRGASQRGTKPGVVKGDIRKWIDDKGINPTDISKDELAFLITRKIHREGYEGKDYVQPVIDEVLPEVSRLIEEGIEQDLNELFT